MLKMNFLNNYAISTKLVFYLLGFIRINACNRARVEQRLHGLFHLSYGSKNISARTKYVYL